MDLFAKRNPEKSLRSQEIKSQVVELLRLDEHATVMVTELNCKDEECPEVETVIAVFRAGRPKLQITLASSIEEVTSNDIERACRSLDGDSQQPEASLTASEDDNHIN